MLLTKGPRGVTIFKIIIFRSKSFIFLSHQNKRSHLLSMSLAFQTDERLLKLVYVDFLANPSLAFADVHRVVHVVLVHQHRVVY